jgi:aminoglycoside phosphotransferase (APT) family kinase protein
VDNSVRALVETLLPGTDLSRARVEEGGQFHRVVLLPDRAVVRIARTAQAAAELPRRTELLRRLARAGLPFAVPEPLGEVAVVDGLTGVALSRLPGAPAAKGSGDPDRLAGVLRALAEVDVRDLADVLAEPHAFAGGAQWPTLMLDGVVPLLPRERQAEARARIEAVLDLPPVPPSLVHGDLAGANLHWHPDGSLAGVLDWDFAQPFDQALDAACLAWFGWAALRAATIPETFARAISWYRVFGLEQIAVRLLQRSPADELQRVVGRTVAWLDHSARMSAQAVDA